MADKLTRDRILDTAIALADQSGIGALSMRNLAKEVGVEAMSLYHHVANKDDLLDGMVDRVIGEFALPSTDGHWRAEMQERATSMRAALRRHPWATGLMDSRATPGDATIRHHDSVLGCLRRNGFSLALAGHAFALLDGYVYGFALQDRNLPFETEEELRTLAAGMVEQFPAERYPHFVAFTVDYVLQPGYDFGDEFAFGLELILDGLERASEQSGGASGPD